MEKQRRERELQDAAVDARRRDRVKRQAIAGAVVFAAAQVVLWLLFSSSGLLWGLVNVVVMAGVGAVVGFLVTMSFDHRLGKDDSKVVLIELADGREVGRFTISNEPISVA